MEEMQSHRSSVFSLLGKERIERFHTEDRRLPHWSVMSFYPARDKKELSLKGHLSLSTISMSHHKRPSFRVGAARKANHDCHT